jgi:hypothetical protein
MNISGVVTGLDSKVITSAKSGKKFKVHYIELDTGDRVNVGFNQTFKVGDNATLDAEQQYGELKLSTTVRTAPPTGGATPAPASKFVSISQRPFPVPKTSGETAIIRQNALTNAVTMFCNGALEFVAKKDELKSTDELIEEVVKMAYKFAEFSSGNREVQLAADMSARATKKAQKVLVQVPDEDDYEEA